MAAESGSPTESFEATAEKVVKCLGLCRFSCGGELSSTDKFQLMYVKKDGKLCEVFSEASDADVQQLLDACTFASFGVMISW